MIGNDDIRSRPFSPLIVFDLPFFERLLLSVQLALEIVLFLGQFRLPFVGDSDLASQLAFVLFKVNAFLL